MLAITETKVYNQNQEHLLSWSIGHVDLIREYFFGRASLRIFQIGNLVVIDDQKRTVIRVLCAPPKQIIIVE